MIEHALIRLEFVLGTIPSLLSAFEEAEFSAKPVSSQWSKKEIIGHLIDSAANNHQRFVRAQFEHIPTIRYEQNKWNECSFHQEISAEQIIAFWTIYNKQILEIVKRIPEEHLSKEMSDGEKVMTIDDVFIDYVEHMEHHLKQVLDY